MPYNKDLTNNVILHMPNYVFWKDTKLNYRGCNYNFSKLIGLSSPDEIIGHGTNSVSIPFLKYLEKNYGSRDHKILEMGEMVSAEEVTFDGKLYLLSTCAIYDNRNTPSGVITTLINVSARKKQNNNFYPDSKIQQSYLSAMGLKSSVRNYKNMSVNECAVELIDYLERIIGCMPGNIYWLNKDCILLGGNDNLANMFGLKSREELVGLNYEQMSKLANWTEGQGELFKRAEIEVMSTGIPKFNIEEPPVVINGSAKYYMSNKVPLYNNQKEIIGVLGISLDITERKKAQEEIEIAKEKAEATSQAKSEFIANMSHDVKTPLSGIIFFSEFLGSKVPQNLHKITQDMLGAGKQLMQFFDNCMELAKLENHSLAFSKETFSLKHLLSEIFTLFRPAIKAKGLSLYIDYSAKIPAHLLGSRVSLYRVLLNLIGNAIKFTKTGSIKVSAALGEDSTAEKAIIKLTVADTGIGIPQSKRELIFEKFSRLTPSYQGTYEGHGIGLYLVKEFVEAMQGEVHLESKKGKGSEFMIVMPFQKSLLTDNEYKDSAKNDIDLNLLQIQPESDAAQDQMKILEKTIPISKPKKAKRTHLKTGPRVLAVEDTPFARDAIEALLNDLGCQVEIAEDGQTAIFLFEPGKYDLVFMDIGLPDMKGYDVSSHFRVVENGSTFNVPILGLSAHASQEEEVLSFEAGMNEMLNKPLLKSQAKAIFERYNLQSKLPDLSEQSEQNSEISSLFAKGKNGLRVIDLSKPKTASDLTAHEKNIWDILDQVIQSFPETRAEIALLYKTLNTPQPKTKTLIATVHKFHGGICYTSTPHFLHAIRALETHLKAGELEKNVLDALYQDFLEAMELLEKTYRSLL